MMAEKYIIGIDQSTQGTKAMLFDQTGDLLERMDLPHEQIINEKGWVEHDPIEIYENTVELIRSLVDRCRISRDSVAGIGISSQRETALVWDRATGEPVYNAVVWQCARGADICNQLERQGVADLIREHTGLSLSPYFSAAKIAWVLQNVEGAQQRADRGELCCGTVDSWLLYRLTAGAAFKTDYSNASRTQMFNIRTLKWDEEVCSLFGIPTCALAQVCDSNSHFGDTDVEGFFDHPIPIHSMLGDSHAALFGQGCLKRGMIKSTYGTGSSVMMNIGSEPVFSEKGVVTSLAWGMDGNVEYVLEGNINNTGAVVSWLQKDLGLIASASETQELAERAHEEDQTYLVPAFTGLGAPYWDSKARGIICGMSRTTGKREIVKAALDCIAYQIVDIVRLMSEEAGLPIREIRVDGGPTRNGYLMQFQSDMLGIDVQVPKAEELSGIGAAFAAGLGLGIYDKKQIFSRMTRTAYHPRMQEEERDRKYQGWKDAVRLVLAK